MVCERAFLLSRAVASDAGAQNPLPDAATLLREVDAHQNQLDRAREDYTFRAVQTTRQLDSGGRTKRSKRKKQEIFFVNGRRIEKLVRKDGKNLTPDQARKEDERVNKEVKKASQPGHADPDKDEITVARLLQIVSFSHPRRVKLNGRDTIAFDFIGDTHAKTHGQDEEALKKVSGTLWIDEQDREVSRMSAALDDNYRVGFGLLASVAKGSNVVFDQALIRNEAWLPTRDRRFISRRGAFLLVCGQLEVGIRFDDYRKFGPDDPRGGGGERRTVGPEADAA